jgi:hypothetical protein
MVAVVVTLTTKVIDDFRDARLGAGYSDPVIGKTFQTDPDSIGKITAIGASAVRAILMTVTPAPNFPYISADNTVVTMTPAEADAWSQRVANWVSATYFYARSLKDLVLAGTPPTNYRAGWP